MLGKCCCEEMLKLRYELTRLFQILQNTQLLDAGEIRKYTIYTFTKMGVGHHDTRH